MEKFGEYVLKQSKYYKSNNIMLTMGMDFHFQVKPFDHCIMYSLAFSKEDKG